MSSLRRSARVAAQPKVDNVEVDSEVDEDELAPPVKRVKKEVKVKSPQTKSSTEELDVGSPIPELTLKDQDENEINLAEIAGEKRILIIFAYPKASTPGCTRQACGFRNNYDHLKSKATVLGLSADSPKAQKTFATKQSLQYPLLSDPSRELIGLLGAKKNPTGIIRSHWIFVDGVLKIKKVGIKPEDSFNGGKESIDQLYEELGEEEPEEPKEPVEPKEEAEDDKEVSETA